MLLLPGSSHILATHSPWLDGAAQGHSLLEVLLHFLLHSAELEARHGLFFESVGRWAFALLNRKFELVE